MCNSFHHPPKKVVFWTGTATSCFGRIFSKKKLIIFWNSKKIFIFACRIAIKN